MPCYFEPVYFYSLLVYLLLSLRFTSVILFFIRSFFIRFLLFLLLTSRNNQIEDSLKENHWIDQLDLSLDPVTISTGFYYYF